MVRLLLASLLFFSIPGYSKITCDSLFTRDKVDIKNSVREFEQTFADDLAIVRFATRKPMIKYDARIQNVIKDIQTAKEDLVRTIREIEAMQSEIATKKSTLTKRMAYAFSIQHKVDKGVLQSLSERLEKIQSVEVALNQKLERIRKRQVQILVHTMGEVSPKWKKFAEEHKSLQGLEFNGGNLKSSMRFNMFLRPLVIVTEVADLFSTSLFSTFGSWFITRESYGNNYGTGSSYRWWAKKMEKVNPALSKKLLSMSAQRTEDESQRLTVNSYDLFFDIVWGPTTDVLSALLIFKETARLLVGSYQYYNISKAHKEISDLYNEANSEYEKSVCRIQGACLINVDR